MKTNSNKQLSIEQEIRSIFARLSESMEDGLIVKMDKVPKMSVYCNAVIGVYRCGDLQKPVMQYAFYKSIYVPDKLGSVAVYGDDATSNYASIKMRRSLFGHVISSVTIEMGRRPFVDVKFAS